MDDRTLQSTAELMEPQAVLARLAPSASGMLRAERIGIARYEGRRFRNVGLWDRDDGAVGPGTFFESAGTAGFWVVESDCAIAGRQLSEMERYPQTLGYLVRERFGSNMIVPLDLGRFGSGILYTLSRTPGAFSFETLPLGMRLRDVVEPSLKAYCAAGELADGAEEPKGGTAESSPVTGVTPTLNDVQRWHIEDVLRMTNGIIEGPRGAAARLGLRPSTLRSRMRKLGVSRPTEN